MVLVCPKTVEFDTRAATLVLAREDEGRLVSIFAYLKLTGEGIEQEVQTDCLRVAPGHHLDECALRIREDSGLLQLVKEKLLNADLESHTCSSDGWCYALGSQADLEVALTEVGGRE